MTKRFLYSPVLQKFQIRSVLKSTKTSYTRKIVHSVMVLFISFLIIIGEWGSGRTHWLNYTCLVGRQQEKPCVFVYICFYLHTFERTDFFHFILYVISLHKGTIICRLSEVKNKNSDIYYKVICGNIFIVIYDYENKKKTVYVKTFILKTQFPYTSKVKLSIND